MSHLFLFVLMLLGYFHVPFITCDPSPSSSRPLFPIAALCTIPDLTHAENPSYNGLYDIPCSERSDGYQLFQQHVNNNGGLFLNGIYYNLNITYINVGFGVNDADPSRVTDIAKRLLHDNEWGYFPLIIAPYSSLYTLIVAQYAEAAKRVVYASAGITDLIYECPSPPDADCAAKGKKAGSRRFQYTYSTNPTAYPRWNGLIYTAKVAGAQTVAIIDGSDIASIESGQGAQAAALTNNLQVIDHRILTGNQTLGDRTLIDTWLTQVRIKVPNLDVLIVNNWHDAEVGCGTILLSLRDMNWLPKSVSCAWTPSTPQLISFLGGGTQGGETQHYVVSGATFDPRIKATVDPSIYDDLFTSSVDNTTHVVKDDAAMNAYRLQTTWRPNKPWSFQYAMAYMDMTIMQRALAEMNINYTHVYNTSDSQQMTQGNIFTDALKQATQGLFEPTWFGRLQFDQAGRLASDVIIGQTRTTVNAYDVIYPLSSQTAPFIYPMPTWDERVYSPGYIKLSSEKLVIGINTAVIVVSLGLAVFVIVWRNAKTVRASSPYFLLCMLLGCILMNSSIYTWTLYETNASCFAHVWLFSIGYILMFAPLFAKTWRLYRIFSSDHLQVEVWTDGKLFGLVCLPFLVLEIMYLVIWSSVSPFQAQTTVIDPIRPMYNYDSCYYNNTSQGFFLASLSYKILFLAAGCVLIFIARNIPSSFNETPFIALAIYNVLFSSAILVPIVATDALGRESRFLVRSFGIMIATLLGQLIIVIPKMYHLITYGDVKLSLSQHHSSGPTSKRAASPTTTHGKATMMTEQLSPRALSDAPRPGSISMSGPNPYEPLSTPDLHASIAETQIKLMQMKRALSTREGGAAVGGDGMDSFSGMQKSMKRDSIQQPITNMAPTPTHRPSSIQLPPRPSTTPHVHDTTPHSIRDPHVHPPPSRLSSSSSTHIQMDTI